MFSACQPFLPSNSAQRKKKFTPLWVALLLHLAKSTPWKTRVFFRPWVDRKNGGGSVQNGFFCVLLDRLMWFVWFDWDKKGTKNDENYTKNIGIDLPGNWKCAIIMIDSGYLIQFPGNWWFVGDNWIKPTKNISHKNMCRKMMGPQAWFWVP